MPRGVYDRSESKIKRVTDENVKLHKQIDSLKTQLEKKELELSVVRRAEPTMPAAPREETKASELFTVLRDNLRSMAESRGKLADSDQVASELISALDREISEHIMSMAHMREQSFGQAQAPVPHPVAGVTGMPMVPFPDQSRTTRQPASR